MMIKSGERDASVAAIMLERAEDMLCQQQRIPATERDSARRALFDGKRRREARLFKDETRV